MAANELEEKERLTQDIYKAMQIHWLSERHDAILSIIESEKVKAVEEYRQKLNAYWPEGSEEPTLSSEQVKTILDNVLKERNK